jgi:hypothetical protein
VRVELRLKTSISISYERFIVEDEKEEGRTLPEMLEQIPDFAHKDGPILSRLLYLCSLPHSGSTMFSLFLGTHSRMVGLGGIDRAVQVLAEALEAKDDKKLHKLPCTCGVNATECPYWGPVAKEVSPRNWRDRRVRYELALEVFERVFGPEAWPVDSSKHVEPLDDVHRISGLDLKVIHVIKDVRSLTASFIDQARRNKARTRPGPILAIEYFHRWLRENRKIEQALSHHKISTQRIGYEEACLAPESTMKTISGFVGVPVEKGSLQLRESRSHLIVGNRMRGQEEKQTLRYDHRWFARRDWLLAAFLMPHILRYNSTAVYSNESTTMWSK